MSQEIVVETLQYLSVATTLFLVCRLFQLRLHQSYRWFFAYLLVDLAGSIAGLLPLSDPNQVRRYVVGQSLRAILAGAVVFEIYKLALVDRPAIALAGRKFVAGALVLGLAIAGVQFYLRGPVGPHQNLNLQDTVLLELSIGATELLLLGVIAGFLSWFPIQLRKNLILYILGFVGFFAVQWGTRMAMLSTTRRADLITINEISFLLTQICVFVWILALSRAGESKTSTTAPQWSAVRVEHLQRRLDEINRDLERFVR